MWTLTEPWWGLIIRAVVVYLALLFLLRVSGKRQIGQLAPFDLVLLLVVSNALQNSMIGSDNSIPGGMISVVTLICLNATFGYLTHASKNLEDLIEGKPQVLIHNGLVDANILKSAQMTKHELLAALRLSGCSSVEEVHVAILENNGSISVLERRPK